MIQGGRLLQSLPGDYSYEMGNMGALKVISEVPADYTPTEVAESPKSSFEIKPLREVWRGKESLRQAFINAQKLSLNSFNVSIHTSDKDTWEYIEAALKDLGLQMSLFEKSKVDTLDEMHRFIEIYASKFI